VKKVYFSSIVLLIIAVSCSSAPKSQDVDSIVQELSVDDTAPQPKTVETIIVFEGEAAAVQPELTEETPNLVDNPADDIDEIVDVIEQEESVTEVTNVIDITDVIEVTDISDLAEADDEEVPADESGQLALAEPEPVERPLRAFEQPPQIEWASPSPVQEVPPPSPAPEARPEPPPPLPPPAPVAKPQPPPLPPQPPVAEAPVEQEPLPLDEPELPNPTGAVGGWQDENAIVPMVFSRVVRATVGQLVEVPFRGTGWVYLGEDGAQRGIVYDSRRLDPEGQSFIFKTERAGVYALKFYRQDFIRDFILNDYVQVIVGAPNESAGTGWFGPSKDRGRAVAEPRWPSSLEEAQSRRAENRPAQSEIPAANETIAAPPETTAPPSATPPAAAAPAQSEAPAVTAPPQPPAQSAAPPAQRVEPVQPALQTPTPSAAPPVAATPPEVAGELPPNLSPEGYMQKAKEEFDAGRIASAIYVLDQFFIRYPMGSDEALWLLGQYYEANSPSRNILASLDCYRRLVQEYPQSNRYDAARRRIAYLQRYYININ
jgi:hypothetical protein